MGIRNWLNRRREMEDGLDDAAVTSSTGSTTSTASTVNDTSCHVKVPEKVENLPQIEREALYRWSKVFLGEVASADYTKRFVKSLNISPYHMGDTYWNVKQEEMERIGCLTECYRACISRVFAENNFLAGPEMLEELIRVVTANLVSRMLQETDITYDYDLSEYEKEIFQFGSELLKAVYWVATENVVDFVSLYEKINHGIDFRLKSMYGPEITYRYTYLIPAEYLFELPDFVYEKRLGSIQDRMEAVHDVEAIISGVLSRDNDIGDGAVYLSKLKEFMIKEKEFLTLDFEHILFQYFEEFKEENELTSYNFYAYGIHDLIAAIPQYFPEMIVESFEYQLAMMQRVYVCQDEVEMFEEDLVDLYERIVIYRNYRAEDFQVTDSDSWKATISSFFELGLSGYALTRISDLLTDGLGVSRDEVEAYIESLTRDYLDDCYWIGTDEESLIHMIRLLSNPVVYRVIEEEKPAIIDCFW
ncbi:MAG: hypothetical protein IJ215_00545 [Clostridia bacterium]|nr:hypothetical protein [Clostridia bacterium]